MFNVWWIKFACYHDCNKKPNHKTAGWLINEPEIELKLDSLKLYVNLNIHTSDWRKNISFSRILDPAAFYLNCHFSGLCLLPFCFPRAHHLACVVMMIKYRDLMKNIDRRYIVLSDKFIEYLHLSLNPTFTSVNSHLVPGIKPSSLSNFINPYSIWIKLYTTALIFLRNNLNVKWPSSISSLNAQPTHSKIRSAVPHQYIRVFSMRS